MKNKPLDQLMERINGDREEFSMAHRCLNGICFVSIFSLFFSSLIDYLIDLPAQIMVSAFLGGVLFAIYYYLSRFRRLFRPAYWLMLATICLFVTLSWFYNCGISGPTAIIILIIISAINLVAQGMERAASLLIITLMVGILFCFEYAHPGLVTGYHLRGSRFIDNYASFVIAVVIISFIIQFTVRHFVSERQKAEDRRKQLETSEVQFRLLVESAPDAIFVQTDGRFAYLNAAALRLFGAVIADTLLNTPILDRFHPDYHALVSDRVQQINEERKSVPLMQEVYLKMDGTPVDVEVAAVPIRFQGKDGALVFVRDITGRITAEENLARQNRLMQTILENIPVGCFYTDAATGKVITHNRSAETILRHSIRSSVPELIAAGCGPLNDNGVPFGIADYPVIRVLNSRQPVKHEKNDYRTGDGTVIKLRHSTYPVWDGDKINGVVSLFEDITAELAAEAEHRKLEMQLDQARKMESIGRLAGGVAHDFNNLLSVINGYCELILPGVEPQTSLHNRISKIMVAGQRAAALVSQLLAFSRKQILAPEILDVNALFKQTERMLRRLIGENIVLAASYEPDLKHVKADPAQLEQVLINLAVNARDAMPNGGKLTIETRNVDLDEAYARTHRDIPAGAYVMIAISDTGTGMDRETMKNIFDPFYTTKEMEKGTGLGLASVYGTIKQSGGNIRVYSEPGRGATFKICLPAADEELWCKKPESVTTLTLQGTETILVVEDEKAVMEIIVQVLAQCGYTVYSETDARAAIRFVSGHAGPIHLLITDVIMPNINGKELAEKVTAIKPDTRVIYMSGYTDDAIAHHGVLDSETDFLQKPVRSRDLLETVRTVLDRETAVPGTC